MWGLRVSGSKGIRLERQPESYGLSDEAARVTNPMYASNPATVTTRRTCFCVLSTCKNVGKRRASVRGEYRLRTESYGFGSTQTRQIVRCKHVQLTSHLRNVRCTQPLTARLGVQSDCRPHSYTLHNRASDVRVKCVDATPSPRTTPMQQPQTLRYYAAARIPNPTFTSNAGTQQPLSHWRSLANATAKMFNPMYAFSSDVPPMDQPQTDYQSRENDAVNTPEVTYASIPDDPPMDQPQTDYQARANDDENTPDVSHASIPAHHKMKAVMSLSRFIFVQRCCKEVSDSCEGLTLFGDHVRTPLQEFPTLCTPPIQPTHPWTSPRLITRHVQTTTKTHLTSHMPPYQGFFNTPTFLYATKPDGPYPGGASSRRGVCSFLHARRSCMAAGIAVLLSLVAVGLAPLTFSNKQEISHLSTTVKLDQDKIRQLSATLNVLKRDQDTLRRLSTTVDALKLDQDTLRRLSTTVDALKLDQDTLQRLSTTVDALKRDQDGMSATVDALKRDQDTLRRLSATVDALKQDQDGMSSTVDAVKRGQDDVRRLPTTVDALKCDRDNMSATVDALKRDQDGMSATVDAVKRDQDGMSATADASKRDLDIERSQTPTSEKRLHERTLSCCPEGYTIRRGICYKAFKTGKSFSEAAAACRADGGTLAMPRDAETNAFLVSLYKSLNIDDHFWFGLHDQREEGMFEWVDGSALGSYSSWGPGQPDNYIYRSYGDQDCVAYHGHPTASPKDKDKWFDQPCGFWKNFICQAAPGTCRIRSIS
ncbi:hypothetical protein Bbelb_376620 [Branchiostoma belcheri]|nr:hypothetical protein Bbelb_376620 [Branchiostoma belcheri]